ncbi:phosphoheptose isomerase [Desulfuromusa kysingii]|uniref:Phosphoheptose isomerase n=1 Tax=Desulfuromusa kysingii TaxID=37625 RepID=A0A1H4CXI0_9BACT|nr:D-sedoheptulose 7-phosphate isomerase [Desulfuromusa kysingii]SEA65084.1 phosphoheptose isomerase [Desulfuromusa kysingii]
MLGRIHQSFVRHRQVVDLVSEQLSSAIAESVDVIVNAIQTEKKIFVMGNGGSAADAQHFVAELIGRFKVERRPLPAISLVDNIATLTAISNDYGFDKVFSRQIEALARPGDVVFGISTSGSSENVLSALKLASKKGCITFGLLGRDGGAIGLFVDHPLIVADDDTARIQEAHITIIHILCELIEKKLYPSGANV